MPTSEEEQRRRCIIDPNLCTSGLTQEAALAEELAGYDTGHAAPHEEEAAGRYARMAKGLLQHFTLAARLLLPLLLAGALLPGCTTLARLGRAARPGVTLADGEYRGVARGCVPITGTLLSLAGSADPRLAEAAPLVSFLGIEPVGCILSVEPRVATPVDLGGPSPLSFVRPYFIFCSVSDRSIYEKCATLPLNQQVIVTGTPLGSGGVIRPSRIVWDE